MSFDLSTEFAGLHLNSPIIVGSCPLSAEELQRIAMASNGAGAVVLPSLFEEYMRQGTGSGKSVQTDLNDYLALVKCATASDTVPIIASINGYSSTDWRSTVEQIESAGANAIELSMRPSSDDAPMDPRDLEDLVVHTVSKTGSAIQIPLIVKLTRNFTSIANMAHRLRPHVDGVTLYGSAPVVDIELDSLERARKWGITESGSVLSSLEPIMQLRSQFPNLSIAACGGIGTSIDLIKVLLAGANVGMITSAVYRDGTAVIGSLVQGLTHFMETHDMNAVQELKTKSLDTLDEDCGFWQRDYSEQSKNETGVMLNPAIRGDRFGHAKAAEE